MISLPLLLLLLLWLAVLASILIYVFYEPWVEHVLRRFTRRHFLHRIVHLRHRGGASPVKRQNGASMKSQAVSLQVMAGVPVDCSFWPEDDGWSGVCEKLSVIVRGSSFEDAKKNMEAALQDHIERILREQLGRGSQWVA